MQCLKVNMRIREILKADSEGRVKGNNFHKEVDYLIIMLGVNSWLLRNFYCVKLLTLLAACMFLVIMHMKIENVGWTCNRLIWKRHKKN